MSGNADSQWHCNSILKLNVLTKASLSEFWNSGMFLSLLTGAHIRNNNTTLKTFTNGGLDNDCVSIL